MPSKNIIINKCMTYFYAEKFCLINFPMIPVHFFAPDQPSWQSNPHDMAYDVNLIISIVIISGNICTP